MGIFFVISVPTKKDGDLIFKHSEICHVFLAKYFFFYYDENF